MEEWKAVPTEPGYEASSHGRIRSVDRVVIRSNGIPQTFRGRTLKPWLASDGRPYVSVGGGAKKRVSKLVAEAFLGPRPDGLEVCHGDGIATNNRPENLRYDTHSANLIDDIGHGKNHNSNKTHCKRRHEFTPENTGWKKSRSGRLARVCRECARMHNRDYSKRKKEESR